MAMVNIKLHRFIGAEIVEREFSGKMQQGIWIPLEPNAITIYKEKYYNVSFFVSPSRINDKNRTAYLSLRYPPNMKDTYFRIKKAGLWDSSVKYIGNIYGQANEDFKWQGGKQQKEIDLDKAFEREE